MLTTLGKAFPVEITQKPVLHSIFKAYSQQIVIKDYDRLINYNKSPFIKPCEKAELENKLILYDDIATTTSKQLLKEQKENYELRLKYNDLVGEENELKKFFINITNQQQNIIDNINKISKQSRIRDIKKDISLYLSTLTTIHIQTKKNYIRK